VTGFRDDSGFFGRPENVYAHRISGRKAGLWHSLSLVLRSCDMIFMFPFAVLGLVG